MTRARSRSRAAAALAGVPGVWLRSILSWVVSPETLGGVVDAILADLHVEWAEERSPLRRAGLYARAVGELLGSVALLGVLAGLDAVARRIPVWGLAAAITCGLLFLMQLLIEREAVTPGPPLRPIPVSVALSPPEPPNERSAPLPPRPEPEPEPRSGPGFRLSPAPPTPTPIGPVPGVWRFGPPPPAPPILGADDWASRECLPRVRVEPVYPDREARLGIEGTVLVELEIDATGSVVASQVLESSSPGFSREVRRAVRRWRYQPATEAGVSASCPSVRVLLRFDLP